MELSNTKAKTWNNENPFISSKNSLIAGMARLPNSSKKYQIEEKQQKTSAENFIINS